MKPLASLHVAAKTRTSACAAALWVVFGQLVTAGAQMAPSGYTGAINTPTADVIATGHLVGSVSNTIPEVRQVFPGLGSFGSTNLGFGLVPGFEAVGRLTYDGNLNCDTYDSTCQSTTRDLSVGGKYQLPFQNLPFNSRIAVGMTDYGGAATLYRQYYGVGTATLGPIDVSAGASKATAGGLIHGKFGSIKLRVFDQLQLIAENDSRERRIGMAFQVQALPDLQVAVGTSHKLTNNTVQQPQQMTLTLSYALDGEAVRKGQRSSAPVASMAEATPLAFTGASPNKPAVTITKPQPLAEATPTQTPAQAPDTSAPLEFAQRFANALERAGFSEISVGQDKQHWYVTAEPRGWRKNRLDALAAGLAVWMKEQTDSQASLVLTLTFLQNPVLQTITNGDCLAYFTQALANCRQAAPLYFVDDPMAMEEHLTYPTTWFVSHQAPQFLKPDFELSPSASYTVGTEFGLVDYSVGFSKGWEVPLSKGLCWHGYHTQFFRQSDDFRDSQSYFRRVGLGEKTAWGANVLSYTRPLAKGLWGEVATGHIASNVSGNSLTMMWSAPDGRFKLSGSKANYTQDLEVHKEALHPTLLTARYAMLPGSWNVSFTKGRFLNNDSGFQAMSTHIFGDYRLRFFYRRTGPGNFQTPYHRSFAGFNVTLPIGPKESYALGPTTIRGRDQWALGLETKVGEADNYIEPGYGLFPSYRHGLQTDVMDYDRGDVAAIEGNLHRLRASLRERLAATQTQ